MIPLPQQLYCNGNEESDISISGGTFRNNRAYEMGGAIAAWGTPALVQITGGTFENNHARYFLICQGINPAALTMVAATALVAEGAIAKQREVYVMI